MFIYFKIKGNLFYYIVQDTDFERLMLGNSGVVFCPFEGRGKPHMASSLTCNFVSVFS